VVELIKKASDDELAFEKLMNQYLQDIYNYISFKVNNSADVKDITQDVMLAIFKGIKNYKSSSSFKTWILAITRRKVADYYRKKYAEGSTVPIENYSHLAANDNKNINDIISDLSINDQELLNLVFIHGCTYKEVSKIINVPVGTIKSRMHYLKIKLKPRLME